MLILWKGCQRDPSRGWAHTFLTQMEEVLGTCVDRGIKVVTNAGGLNPAGLADQVRALADRLGLSVSVAHVEGDDLLPRIGELDGAGHTLAHLDTGAAAGRGHRRGGLGQRLPRGLAHRRGAVGRGRRGRLPAGSPTPPWWWGRRPGTTAGRRPTGTAWPGRWRPATSSSAGPRPPGATTPSSPRCPGSSTPASPSPRWPRTARRSSPSTRAPAARCRWGRSPPSCSTRSPAPTMPTPTWWPDFDTVALDQEGTDRVRMSGRPGPARPRPR